MPLAELNLGWILPAAVGVIVGLILSGKKAEA